MKIIPIALLAISILSGCATNTMTGRSQLSLVSESRAISEQSKMYSGLMTSYDQSNKLVNDPMVNERVQTITNRLVERAVLYKPDAQKWKWQVNVIENKDVNAFCMAGGKMGIYTGFLEKVQPTDDELAQVMGHEISHALANHTAEKMSSQIIGKIVVATAGVAAAAANKNNPNQYQRNQNIQNIEKASALAAAAFLTLPNSRETETEADKLGIELSAQAGYDPKASISVWKKMMEATGSKSRGDFMSTHPSPPKRIEAFEALQEPMEKIYSERKSYYTNYKPSYQYVSMGYTMNEENVLQADLSTDAPIIDSSKALAFYDPHYESFKAGTLEFTCKSCGLKFYMKEKELKSLLDKRAWRDIAQNLIKIDYQFDLTYYYLGLAAEGLEFKEAAKAYFKKAYELSQDDEFSCSHASLNKCNDLDVKTLTASYTN